MLKKMNNIFTKNKVLIFLILLTIFLLVPIIWASLYSYPSADDFSYGTFTINVLNNKGIFALLKGVGRQIHKSYYGWQGTFSAVTLFSLNPSVFGGSNLKCYFLTPIIIITLLFIGLYCLFKQVIKLIKSKSINLWFLTLGFFLLILQTLPDKTQGLFWWNGASYYMIFCSLELVEIAILIKRYFLNKKTKLNYFILSFLAFFISGGNYITALQQVIILVLLNLYLFFIKKDKSLLFVLALAIIGFAISIIAPGNAVRARGVESMSAIRAIIMSFGFGLKKAYEWFTPLNFIVLFLLIILLIPTYKENKFTFKYPLLVILLIYCIFSAEFTPTLYATSNIGEGRLWNIMYISYLLFMFFIMYYLIGFFRRKLIERKVFTTNALENTISIVKNYSFVIGLSLVAVISTILITNKYSMTSYNTYRILRNGEAKTYSEEYKKRISILNDEKIKDVTFEKLSNYPYPIFYTDYSTDADSWLNEPVTKIFNKNFVKVKE